MADDSFKIKKSINLEDNSTATTEQGDIRQDSGDIKYYDGSAERTVVNTDATQTLSNKTLTSATIDSDNNTITNIVNADIKAGAAIARDKLADGTADYVVINDGTGTFSEEAQLAISRGGTGQSSQTGAFDALSPTTTKGDIIVDNGTNAIRVAIGSDTEVLTADSGQASGVAWTAPVASNNPYLLQNVGLTASVAANALTVTMKASDASTSLSAGSPAKISFRDATQATGGYVTRTVTSDVSITITSGSTLGTVDNREEVIHVYAIDNAGTVVLGVVVGNHQDEGNVHSTTDEGGAGGADTRYTLYTDNSVGALTSKAIRYIGKLHSTQTTAGTWAAAPSLIAQTEVFRETIQDELMLSTPAGHGSSSTKIREFTSTEISTGNAYTDNTSATLGTEILIKEEGLYFIRYQDVHSASAGKIGISLNSSNLTTDVNSLSLPERLCHVDVPSAVVTECSVMTRLSPGDVIRPHTDQNQNTTGDNAIFHIIRIAD